MLHTFPYCLLQEDNTPPWVTDVVRGAFRRRSRARRLAKRSNTAEAWHRFKKCRNKAVSAVRSARSDCFSSLQPQTDRSKKFWKSYHNLSSSTTKVPATISNGASSASAPGDKASLFNDYFATCFSVHDPVCSDYANTTSHLAPLDVSSPPLAEITCDWTDVTKAIKRLRHNTASGPDGISATTLKECYSSICGRLACLFNTSFSTGKIPSAWKISNVTPINKKGDASLVQNYRPISLLSLAGKLQERLVHNLLLDHLLGGGATSSSQFGFQPSSSTQEPLYQLPKPGTNIWRMGLAQFVCSWTWRRPLIRYVSHQGVIDALAGSGVCGRSNNIKQPFLEAAHPKYHLQSQLLGFIYRTFSQGRAAKDV